jgi:hypothetical protein
LAELEVTSAEYNFEVEELQRKRHRIRTTRTEWTTYLDRRTEALRIAAERRALAERLTGIAAYEEREVAKVFERRALAYLLLLFRTRRLIERLRREIDVETERLKRKVVILPKKVLSRIKVRIYNEEASPITPTGMFQTFWDIDAVVDTETGEVDWGYEFESVPEYLKKLTLFEILIAKTHMVGYFKGMAKWTSPEQMSLAYFMETEGIRDSDQKIAYKRKRTGETYTRNIPAEFIERAETLTVEELIVGISSVKPEPIINEEDLGVFFQRAMIIDEHGVIKWDEIRNKWVWRPSKSAATMIINEMREKRIG